MDNRILNNMASRNPDRELHCSVSPTQAPRVEKSSQQQISPFASDSRIPQNRRSVLLRKLDQKELDQKEIVGHVYGSAWHRQSSLKTGCDIQDSKSVQFMFKLQITRKAPEHPALSVTV